jgi:hypothetical protein
MAELSVSAITPVSRQAALVAELMAELSASLPADLAADLVHGMQANTLLGQAPGTAVQSAAAVTSLVDEAALLVLGALPAGAQTAPTLPGATLQNMAQLAPTLELNTPRHGPAPAPAFFAGPTTAPALVNLTAGTTGTTGTNAVLAKDLASASGGSAPSARLDASGASPVARQVNLTHIPTSLLHTQQTEFRENHTAPSKSRTPAQHDAAGQDSESGDDESGDENDTLSPDDEPQAADSLSPFGNTVSGTVQQQFQAQLQSQQKCSALKNNPPWPNHAGEARHRPDEFGPISSQAMAASFVAPLSTMGLDASHSLAEAPLYQHLVAALRALNASSGPVFEVLSELKRQRRVLLATPQGLSFDLRCNAHVDVLIPAAGGLQGRAIRLKGELLWAQHHLATDWFMTHLVKSQTPAGVRQLSPMFDEEDGVDDNPTLASQPVAASLSPSAIERQIAVCLGAQATPMVAWSQACLRVHDGNRLWRALESQWSLRLAISATTLGLPGELINAA